MSPPQKNPIRRVSRVIGVTILPVLWGLAKSHAWVSDRYLPSIQSVIQAAFDIQPSIVLHLGSTVGRLMIGFALGALAGLALGMLIASSDFISDILSPVIGSTRSVPGVALIPFFLLWFGFSEWGRYLLVICGIAFNIAVATKQIIDSTPEQYHIMFASLGRKNTDFPLKYMLPYVAENILPTLRFSLSMAIGLVVTSELLGSQIGLGYLIQTSLNTFSLNVLFLVAIILGLLSTISDSLLTYTWKQLTYWTKS